jgi:MoxR-like ATPase
LQEALYRYDAVGRLYARNLEGETPAIEDYLQLGPLGTALLPTEHPRALLIDEIDKSDVDLPNDLLNVFERGEFEIPELARLGVRREVEIREHESRETFPIVDGKVACYEFPFVVLTSNGEREFPPAFLRRCIRLVMPDPSAEHLAKIVAAHLGTDVATASQSLIVDFADRAKRTRSLATDQLMNAIFLVTREESPGVPERDRIVELLLKHLTADEI